MSYLWYWPAGGWNFDNWKSHQTWRPIKTEQSGKKELILGKHHDWEIATAELLGRKLAVSFHVVGESGPMTWHAKALTTSYLTAPSARRAAGPGWRHRGD